MLKGGKFSVKVVLQGAFTDEQKLAMQLGVKLAMATALVRPLEAMAELGDVVEAAEAFVDAKMGNKKRVAKVWQSAKLPLFKDMFLAEEVGFPPRDAPRTDYRKRAKSALKSLMHPSTKIDNRVKSYQSFMKVVQKAGVAGVFLDEEMEKLAQWKKEQPELWADLNNHLEDGVQEGDE